MLTSVGKSDKIYLADALKVQHKRELTKEFPDSLFSRKKEDREVKKKLDN